MSPAAKAQSLSSLAPSAASPPPMADDEPTRVPLLAVVYKTQTQTLGAAYLEDGTTLRYCEVADTEFHMLRSLKFELNPDLIIAPANADAVWLAQLGSSSRGADAETLLDDADPAVDEADPDGEAGTIPVQLGKSRDFSASAAAKRLVLLMHGRAQDDDQLQLTERESLIRLEHQLPREQEQAWRAVGGLLAHLQKEDAGQLSISTLAPHALDKVMRIAPEVLLSLNIFVDRHHPSVHGGKSRDAFSLWSLFNNTSSKPGEKLLRSWFARPSLDLEVLSQRQESIAFVISRQELLPQWKTLAKKIKDVRGLRASFDRGSSRSSAPRPSSCGGRPILAPLRRRPPPRRLQGRALDGRVRHPHARHAARRRGVRRAAPRDGPPRVGGKHRTGRALELHFWHRRL